jgi:hypothetical protein
MGGNACGRRYHVRRLKEGSAEMSNWFEDNATKSVIGYTLVIAGATWATSTFILQDNRLNLARSELETQKSLTEQYKSKTEILQRDIDALRSDATEYRTWLGQTKDAIPAIVPRITELKGKVALLEAESTRLRAAAPTTPKAVDEHSVALGIAFIDNVTGLVFTVKAIAPNRMATVVVKLPDRDLPFESTIGPGQQWSFKSAGKNLLLTVTEIKFFEDVVRFQIAAVQ